METMPAAIDELRSALELAELAASQCSNDDEIAELNRALDLALTRWPEVQR